MDRRKAPLVAPTGEYPQPKTSYVLSIKGFQDAPQIADVERDLKAIPGVQAKLAYSPPTAWITAPEDLDPAVLDQVFATHGLSTTPTQSATMRAAEDPGTAYLVERRRRALQRYSRQQRSLRNRYRVRAYTPQERAALLARQAGFLSSAPLESLRSFDALYTARDLITVWRVVVAVVLTIPVMALTYMDSLQFDGWQWVMLLLSTPVATWCAWPFHRAFAGGVRRGVAALDGASSLAIVSSYLWSVATLLFTPAKELTWRSSTDWFGVSDEGLQLFFDVACGITALLLVGRSISAQSRVSLPADLAEEAVEPGQMVTVDGQRIPLSEVNPGDDLTLHPGERIPVDGLVIGGAARIRTSVIEPGGWRNVKVGDSVYAGSLVADKPLKVRAQFTGHGTHAASVERWVRGVQARQRHVLAASSKQAAGLITAAFAVAVLGGVSWFALTRDAAPSFGVYLAALAVVAPTSQALAVALPLRLGIDTAARRGILVSEGSKFRDLTAVDTVIFNRVGTLVDSEMEVDRVSTMPGENPDTVLRVAAALCVDSNHPSSKAIVQAARASRDKEAGARWLEVTHRSMSDDGTFTGNVELVPGQRSIYAELWRPRRLSEVMGPMAYAALNCTAPLVVRWDGKDRGVIGMHDKMKPDAPKAVDALDRMGLTTLMLSRDMYPVARRFADAVGISRLLAGIASGRKEATVRSLHTRGSTTALVGDSTMQHTLGVADVGIMVTGTVPVVRRGKEHHNGVDVVVLREDVSAIPELFTLAKRVTAVVQRNYWFSKTYSTVGLVCALTGWLHPMLATVCMLLTTLVVEVGSNTVRRGDSGWAS